MTYIVSNKFFKENVDEILDYLEDAEDHVFVTRDVSNKDPIVVMTLEEFNGYKDREETNYKSKIERISSAAKHKSKRREK